MKCFVLESGHVTRGLPVISAPFPHVGFGTGGPRPYTKINISTKMANSLLIALSENRWQCEGNRQDRECPRKRAGAVCGHNCSERRLVKTGGSPEYNGLMECCIIVTANGDFLIVSPRGSDTRGLLHVKLGTEENWRLSLEGLDGHVKILAANAVGRDTAHYVENGHEYLLVMNPGTTFEASHDDASVHSQISAYYDGFNVHAEVQSGPV